MTSLDFNISKITTVANSTNSKANIRQKLKLLKKKKRKEVTTNNRNEAQYHWVTANQENRNIVSRVITDVVFCETNQIVALKGNSFYI